MNSGHPSKVINRYISAFSLGSISECVAYLDDVITVVVLDAIDYSTVEFSD